MPRKLHDWYRSTLGPALVGAALLWAALPPLDIGPLAWIAPLAWVLLIRRNELAGRRPYTALWLAGLLFWLAALHWLRLPHWATSFGWLALAVYFACYVPLFVGLSRVAVHRLRVPVILAAPVVWTGLELARAHLLTGMTMASLGHTQYRWVELIQVSDLTGAYGVSFLVMFVAACLARMLPCPTAPLPSRQKSGREGESLGATGGLSTRAAAALLGKPAVPPSLGKPAVPPSLDNQWACWPLAPAAAALVGVLVYGHVRMSGDFTAPGARIALIQGSIDTEMKTDDSKREQVFKHYLDLSDEAVEEGQGVDLVVWPETMFGDTLVAAEPDARKPDDLALSQEEFQRRLGELVPASRQRMSLLARRLKTPLLLGVDTNDYGRDGVRQFNSAAFVSADGELLGRYDKMHPVMFGEYVPFADVFPWLQRLTPLPCSLTAGERPAAFRLGDCPNFRSTKMGLSPSRSANEILIAPNICYESVLPHLVRRQVNLLRAEGREPQVLVNLTNDGWFWGSSELDMHLVCAVFRAVECRKPFLIAANTGFSAWIDGNGRILAQGPRRAARPLLADVRVDRRGSWYLAHGDWAAGGCLAACLLLAVVGTRRPSPLPPGEGRKACCSPPSAAWVF
ncbi:MAG: apolipoprotein N-acyltransferase [Thermoguttaceae bacterium]|jgi:apolipoprotein N-acyltransferase